MGEACIRQKNKYKIDDNLYIGIEKIIDDYLQKIDKRIISDGVEDNSEKIAILGIIAESYELFNDEEKWLEHYYSILTDLKKQIELRQLGQLSIIEGISNIALYVSLLVEKSQHFAKLADSLNHLICDGVEYFTDLYLSGKKVVTGNFDAVYGLSGVGNYLLSYSEQPRTAEVLRKIADYMVFITCCKAEISLPGWYISYDDEPMKEYYGKYKDGYINFSLSHGIGGPLAFLVYAYDKGIRVEGHKAAVYRIVQEYEKVTFRSKDLWFTQIIGREEFLKDTITNENIRESWCYGNASMLFVLYRAGEVFGEENWKRTALDKLLILAEKDLRQYQLHSPIICHGYAGTLTIFRRIYDVTGKKEFFKPMLHLLKAVLKSYDENSIFGFKDERWDEHGIVIEEKNEFLTGAAGIIFELSAWIKEESCFERVLLLR